MLEVNVIDIVADNNKFPALTIGGGSQVNFNLTDSKKATPAFEVNVQPEPQKIVEAVRLQDGSQSFRIQWKDTWLHEQYISAFPDLVNEFLHGDKNDLVNDENSVKCINFEDSQVVSTDNDTYSIHPFLLTSTDNKEKLNANIGFIGQNVESSYNSASNISVENIDDDDDDENDDENEDIDENDDDKDDLDTNDCDEMESEQEYDFIDQVYHVTPHIINSSDTTAKDISDGEILSNDEGGILRTDESDKIISEVENGLASSSNFVNVETDIQTVMAKITSANGVVNSFNVPVNNKVPSLVAHGASFKRKVVNSSKKSKKTKKRVQIKVEKKLVKSKQIQDDEKENLEDQGSSSRHSATNCAGSIETNDSDGNKGTPEKREKFPYPESKGPCVCDICGKIISNKYGLREHQTVVHFKNGKFECQICGKRVTNKRALNLHMTSHSNERQFVCELCGSSHKTKGNLNYHVKTMHTMIKNFRCDICFKTFKVQAELKDHCFTVHANEGVITCIVCKKKLTTALSIYTHSVMHSGAREHECDICGYAFKTLTGLKEHKVTHSEDKPIRQCPYCERKFFSRSQYNAHVMRHTADGSLITYKCPICDVKFQHKSSYNRHVIRHQPGGDLEFPKENPYLLLDESELPEGVCVKCRKHYSSKSGFYLHLKKCRDGIIQQFQCPYCERGCSNRCSLKRHIQRRHKTEQQRISDDVIMEKQNIDTVDAGGQNSVMPADNIQYQGTFFDQGYGNQITAVDASQLSAVDLQLLLDTSTQNETDTATHILSNVTQVAQLTQNGDAAQSLHILTESEAAQFAAQLSQHGVIVRSSDAHREQGQEQHLIVGTTQIDGHTSQLLVSERQAAQLLASAQLTENSTLALDTNDRQDSLRGTGVLQFDNNRTAVIQIQHNDVITQQVLTMSDQPLHYSLETPASQDMNTENVQVTELQSSNDMECDSTEVQQYIEEEQIVSGLESSVDQYQTISLQ